MDGIEIKSAYLKSIRVGKIQAKFSADGTRVLRYYLDFWNEELSLHKELAATDLHLLQSKANELMAAWDRKVSEHRKKSKVVAGKDAADQMTVDALGRLERLNKILSHTLSVDDRVDWNSLKNSTPFPEDQRFPESRPVRRSIPAPVFSPPILSFWDKILGRKGLKMTEARNRHERAVEDWKSEEQRGSEALAAHLAQWEAKKAAFDASYNLRKAAYLEEQRTLNNKVDELSSGVSRGEAQSVLEHATLVLERSDYDGLFEKSYELDYLAHDKILLLEYTLPSPDDMPTLKAARFLPTTGEIKETHISEKEQKINYDLVGYQICLRTLHEIFEADEYGNIDKVLFNGFASYVDRTSGRDTRACIMSVLVNRSDFESIDLRRVDPKACFKSLKGVSASTLSALAAVPPVMELNKEDRRFIEGRSTVGSLDDTTNLAAMDWGDFEHLVRELFEKEFAKRGGEVKITQASSDGGVDAVAFDPDPITGGKIVIQAKRYTRTVGVNAVRDLYGTMQHEGASRGILITTADYGPDAYGFASGKPITLFTGANLLHLLEKHGYAAKIDLQEARKVLSLREP